MDGPDPLPTPPPLLNYPPPSLATTRHLPLPLASALPPRLRPSGRPVQPRRGRGGDDDAGEAAQEQQLDAADHEHVGLRGAAGGGGGGAPAADAGGEGRLGGAGADGAGRLPAAPLGGLQRRRGDGRLPQGLRPLLPPPRPRPRHLHIHGRGGLLQPGMQAAADEPGRAQGQEMLPGDRQRRLRRRQRHRGRRLASTQQKNRKSLAPSREPNPLISFCQHMCMIYIYPIYVVLLCILLVRVVSQD